MAFDPHLFRIWFNQMHLNQMQVQMQMRMKQMQMQMQPSQGNQMQVQVQMPHLQIQVHLSTSLEHSIVQTRCSMRETRETALLHVACGKPARQSYCM